MLLFAYRLTCKLKLLMGLVLLFSCQAAAVSIEDCDALLTIPTYSHLDYQLEHDIDCYDHVHTQPRPFSGTLNGQGFRIAGLTLHVTQGSHTELFSELKGAHIHHLQFDDWIIEAR